MYKPEPMKNYDRFVFDCENCKTHIETQARAGKCPNCGLKYEIEPIKYDSMPHKEVPNNKED